MSENKLTLKLRTLTGKKLASLRASGLIPSVVYGGKEPILTSSDYNETEKVLRSAGYHSPIDLTIDGKKKMGITKTISLDPVSKRIINIEFQVVSAREAVEATAPIVMKDFEASDASKLYHFELTQTLEEIDIKAKPADLPNSLDVDASKLTTVEDKLTIADIILPEGVEFADKNIDKEQVIASIYDPAAEAASREAESEKESVDAADVPSDNDEKPATEEETKEEA